MPKLDCKTCLEASVLNGLPKFRIYTLEGQGIFCEPHAKDVIFDAIIDGEYIHVKNHGEKDAFGLLILEVE